MRPMRLWIASGTLAAFLAGTALGCFSPADSFVPDPPASGSDAGSVASLPENTAQSCRDGVDNDRDGRPDCTDQDCWDFTFCEVPLPDGGPRNDGGPDGGGGGFADAGADAGGTDGGSLLRIDAGPCNSGSTLCLDEALILCEQEQGEALLLAACSGDALCDPALGCVSACGADAGGCGPGLTCDPGSGRCVVAPQCAIQAQCTGPATCVGGACVPTPSESPVAIVGDAGVAASLGCYLADAGSGAPDASSFSFVGYAVTPIGQVTSDTIGCRLKLFRASELNANAAAAPVASTLVSDAGFADSGWVGGFQFQHVPPGRQLVSLCECPGYVPTYQYFDLPTTAGAVQIALTCFKRSEWDHLRAPLGGAPADRAGVLGQVFDCDGRRVRGATAALSSGERAWYAFPGVFGINPDATVTSDTGRFFFVDVAPGRATLVTSELGQQQVFQRFDVRAMPGGITVTPVRPPWR